MCQLRYTNVIPVLWFGTDLARDEAPSEWHFFEFRMTYLILEQVAHVSSLAPPKTSPKQSKICKKLMILT